MKSIVLCENSLVEQSNNAKELNGTIENKDDNEKVTKNTINGTPNDKNSETVINNTEDSKLLQEDEKKGSDLPLQKEGVDIVKDLDGKSKICVPCEGGIAESDIVHKSCNITCNVNLKVEEEVESLLDPDINDNETDVHSEDNSIEILNSQDSPNESEIKQNFEIDVEVPTKKSENSDVDEREIKEELMTKGRENELLSEDCEDVIEECFKDRNSPKTLLEETINEITPEEVKMKNKESGQPLEDMELDVDENKENEKIGKNNFSAAEEDDVLNDQSSRCEIQVGECQTISDSDKDSLWIDKPEQDLEESTQSSVQGNTIPESESTCVANEIFQKSETIEKDEKQEEEEDIRRGLEEHEEKVEDLREIDEEKDKEREGGEEKEMSESVYLKSKVESEDISHSDPSDLCMNQNTGSEIEDIEISNLQVESTTSRKRQKTKDFGCDASTAKRKKSECDEEGNLTKLKFIENTEDSSPQESSTSPDSTCALAKDHLSTVTEASTTKRTLDSCRKVKKLKVESEKSQTLRTLSGEKSTLTSSFLGSLRGTLKTLTRSDLEELIVQKLCEVITERSTVGELRRKAQSLEQDQEKWKDKVQSLTKLVREMEMVMKKYMAEVQKQTKEANSATVAPLKVTRSVGLQVSFYSSANKGLKQNSSQPPSASPVPNANGKTPKPILPKLPPQVNNLPKNAWHKPTSHPRSSPSPQKSPLQQKKPLAPAVDHGVAQPSRPTVAPPALNNNRPVQNQVQAARPFNKIPLTPQTTQQQQQTNSKVIDLTEDDDRVPGNIAEKTQGPIRVVNHLQQPQNNRFAYILPVSSAQPTGTSAGQNRQVLIATPTLPQSNRQLMCSMPPLLFKGGNVQQQQQQQQQQQPVSQSQMLNQSNRVILPKSLRHPAPLPPPPANQNTKPNLKLLPPRPALKISKVQTGIVLSWNMSLGPEHAPISSYQLYAYQESIAPPATTLWKKVGDVKALPLPMACTLTQFMSGHKYHFAVRAVDHHSRIGPFSFPGTIVLVK